MKRPTQAAYNRLQRQMHGQVDRLAERLAAGKIDAAGFQERFLTILEIQHGKAAALGRQLAGDLTPINDDDREYGAIVADLEAMYLQGFVNDIAAGKYGEGEEIDVARIKRRGRMYCPRLRGTANEAFVAASDEGALFYWHLGMTEDNCGECPDLAEASPYTAKDIPTYPGSGDTPCLFNCKCSIVREDGVSGFLPL